MKRMWDENELKKLIDEYAPGFVPSEIPEGDVLQNAVLGLNADGEAVKGDLFGKYVKIIPGWTGAALTEEQAASIVEGALVDGDVTIGQNTLHNPLFYPSISEPGSLPASGVFAAPVNYSYGALTFAFGTWSITNSRELLIEFKTDCLTYNQSTLFARFSEIWLKTGVVIKYGSSTRPDAQKVLVPALPADANEKTYVLKVKNGVGEWVEPSLCLHTIVFDVGSGQSFTIRLLSDSATPCAVDSVSGNFAIEGASFVQPANMGNVVIIPFGANQITPDIYGFDSATGAFTDNITLASVTSDTVTPIK